MSITGRNKRAPLALLLWAVLLLFGQTAALAHQHTDDLPGTSCAVCSLVKAEIAACDAAPATADPDLCYLPAHHAPVAGLPATRVRLNQPRAPPRA